MKIIFSIFSDLDATLQLSVEEIKSKIKETSEDKVIPVVDLLVALLFLIGKKNKILDLNSKFNKSKKDEMIIKAELLSNHYFAVLGYYSKIFFLESFKWSLTSKQWLINPEYYRNKFIKQEIQRITEILDDKEKTDELNHFFKIIFLYIIEILIPRISKEEFDKIISELIQTSEEYNKTSDVRFKEIYSGIRKETDYPGGFKEFKKHITVIKSLTRSKKNLTFLQNITLDEITKIARDSIYEETEGDVLNIDYKKVKIIEGFLSEAMYDRIMAIDTLYISLISALVSYKEFLSAQLKSKEKKKEISLPEMFKDNRKLKKICSALAEREIVIMNENSEYIWKGIPSVRGEKTQLVALSEVVTKYFNESYDAKTICNAFCSYFHIEINPKLFQDNLSGNCQKHKQKFSFLNGI